MDDLPQPPSPQMVMLIGIGGWAVEDVEWEGVWGGSPGAAEVGGPPGGGIVGWFWLFNGVGIDLELSDGVEALAFGGGKFSSSGSLGTFVDTLQ